ncbi:hypothetical protein O9K63_03140 [Janibacter cremeus]|uniref:hypothetical protein n=1 Tax=Janibacter cremeus TaxID=1285192 RepID=UPI0023F6400F|nr:hypothetical protein [Janibacter cremeus]WEV78805.1 hypothetical protein O9K63_03140 [Janibacter cremeus]
MMGFPSHEMAEDVIASTWQRLGGCVIAPGMWTAECLTCGQRETVEDPGPHFDGWAAPDVSAASAVTRFAARCRGDLDQAETSVVSHAGLWLLLASVAEHVTAEDGERLAEILGLPTDEASALARRLLAEPHPTLAATFGAWVAEGVTTPLSNANRSIPDQAALDQWAAEHTRGLIDRFPIQVDESALLLLATALVLEPRWTEPLRVDEDGRLVLDGGLQTIVRTEAAGLVAVAKPFSQDAVDVLSVIAAPEVPPSQVWQAVDEVAEMLGNGALWRAEKPSDTPANGHAWWCRTRVESIVRSEDDLTRADGAVRRWRSRLRRWSAVETSIDFDDAPGLAEVARALVPDVEDPQFACVQSVRGEFDEDGFRAAAITAGVVLTGMPDFVDAPVERVELDFSGAHAVVAIARGGAWEGIPLVSAWVAPEQRAMPDTDWESLELLADIDPEEAAELMAYKRQRMRERGEG